MANNFFQQPFDSNCLKSFGWEWFKLVEKDSLQDLCRSKAVNSSQGLSWEILSEKIHGSLGEGKTAKGNYEMGKMMCGFNH